MKTDKTNPTDADVTPTDDATEAAVVAVADAQTDPNAARRIAEGNGMRADFATAEEYETYNAARLAAEAADDAAPTAEQTATAELLAILQAAGISEEKQAAMIAAAAGLKKAQAKQKHTEQEAAKAARTLSRQTLIDRLNAFEAESEENNITADISDPFTLRYVPAVKAGERFTLISRPVDGSGKPDKRESLTDAELAAAGLAAFVIDGKDAEATIRSKPVKAHPAAYAVNRAEQTAACIAYDRPCPVAVNLQAANDGKPVERTDAALVAHVGKELTDRQAQDLAEGKFRHGEAASRAVVTQGLKDTTNTVRLTDGTVQTVAEFIKAALALKSPATEPEATDAAADAETGDDTDSSS